MLGSCAQLLGLLLVRALQGLEVLVLSSVAKCVSGLLIRRSQVRILPGVLSSSTASCRTVSHTSASDNGLRSSPGSWSCASPSHRVAPSRVGSCCNCCRICCTPFGCGRSRSVPVARVGSDLACAVVNFGRASSAPTRSCRRACEYCPMVKVGVECRASSCAVLTDAPRYHRRNVGMAQAMEVKHSASAIPIGDPCCFEVMAKHLGSPAWELEDQPRRGSRKLFRLFPQIRSACRRIG